jgi:hypothetical protein
LARRIDGPLVARFAAKVDPGGPTPTHCPELGPCTIWTASLNANGYGQLNIGGRPVPAHRVSWFLAHGAWPSNFLLHKCDNRRCVRIDHLCEGTAADNSADMVRKGRSLRGSRQPSAKITEGDVTAIRAAWLTGETVRSIAQRFPLEESAVALVVTGKRWGHVETTSLPKRKQCLRRTGQLHPKAKITAETAHAIKASLEAGKRVIEIMRLFSTTRSTIEGIRDGRSWRDA